MARRQDVSSGRGGSPFAGSERRQLDRLFAALAKARRRHALRCLVRSSGPLTVSELARRLTQEGQASDAVEAPVGNVGREHASLYHVDLPKLVNAGLVDHDPEANRVRLADPEQCPEVEAVVELLAVTGDTPDRS